MSCCGVGSEAMSSMVRSEKQGGGNKNGCILETISPIELKLEQNVPKGVLYLYVWLQVTPLHWHQFHGTISMLICIPGMHLGVRDVRQSFHAPIITQNWQMLRKDTPFSVPVSSCVP